MKTTCLISSLILSLLFGIEAVDGQVATQNSATVSPVQPTDWQLAAEDADSKVWEKTTYEAGPSGQVVARVHRYTELGTGMNYQDAQGQWQSSVPSFRVVGNSFVADKLPTKVILGSDLNTVGAVTTLTPDGITLNSTPVGIGLYDAASGAFQLIGTITNSIGVLVSSNEVVYQNAFSGVCADVHYTVHHGSFDQDVVLTGRLNPADYGFPTNTTRIQVLTEFYQANKPDSIQRPLYVEKNQALRNLMVSPDLMDDTLGFGQLVFGHGRAFTAATTNRNAGVMVGKEYITVAGRNFMVESVRYSSLSKQLESLPDCETPGSARLLPAGKGKSAYVSIPRAGARGLAKSRPALNPRQLAALKQQPGVVIDYVTINGDLYGNTVFKGDTTYYVNAQTYCEGATTIEGGAVFKYADSALIAGPQCLEIDNTLTCNTSSYRPAIFTAAEDNSVGETISEGGSGSIDSLGYGEPMLLINNFVNQTLNNLRFSYAQTAILVNISASSEAVTINDSQFVKCIEGIGMDAGSSGGSGTLFFNNCLMASVEYVCDFGAPYNIFFCNNCTIASSSEFIDPDNYVYCTNSIFANVTNIGTTYLYGGNNGFYNSAYFGSGYMVIYANPFQTVGAGSYYLTNGSSFHNAGLHVLNEITNKTTYPPLVYSNVTISTNITLALQAHRDTNASPDLGYHYDPLDYVFGGCDLYTNLTVTSGTTVGWFESSGGVYAYGQPYGISLNNGANFTSTGTATQPCWIARTMTVQEGGNGNWTANGYMGGILINGTGSGIAPQLNNQFTKWSTMAGDGNHFRDNWAYGVVNIANTEFYNGGMASYWGPQYFTNCLFFRTQIAFWHQMDAANLTFFNSTFYNGFLAMYRATGQSSSFWTVKNSAFDGTAFWTSDNFSGSTNYTAFDYNAYNSGNTNWQTYPSGFVNTNTLEVIGAHTVIVTNGYNWQTSWLGSFYQPTNSLLINKGSTTADQVGLYHFTTQTNQVPETNSIVDIGYHYVATDSSGNPLDTNGDGIPDYLEDANGNGIFDAGDLGEWKISPFGLGIGKLMVFTPLK